jgi:ACS family tartrate transporter-like MFS transporter
MALVRVPLHLYTGRFLLGLAEAGFFPGVIVYFTHWFPRAERARALAGMIVGLPVSLALGARVSGWVLDVHWFGLAGWQWVFIVEGLPALLVGIALPFIMTDRPRHARWLTTAERDWLEQKLEQERREAAAIGSASLRVVIRRPAVWLLALGIFTANIGGFALLFWLPTAVRELLKRSHAVVTDGEAMNWMLPLYLLGLLGVWISGQLSDRTGKPKLYCMIGLALTGLLLGVSTFVGGSFNNFYAWLLATGLFMFWWPSPFWALLPRTLPPAVLPVAIGFVNMWANLSGAFGPTIVGEMKEAKLSLEACLRFPAVCYLVACGLIAILHVPILKSPQAAIAPTPSEQVNV